MPCSALAVWLLRTDALYRALRASGAPHGAARLAAPSRSSRGWACPAGLSVMVEVTSFTLMALFIARQGTLAAAAHQIAANLAAVLYMMPLSIAIATSARVSYWLGAGDASRRARRIRTGFQLGLLLALVLRRGVVAGRGSIAALYSARPEVVAVAAGLLALAGDATTSATRCRRCACSCCAATGSRSRRWWPIACCCGAWAWAAAIRWPIAAWPLARLHSPAAFWAAGTLALALLGVILPLILWRAVRCFRPA